MSNKIWFLTWICIWGILAVVFTDDAHAGPSERSCVFINQLTPYQAEVANKAYWAGMPYDLGKTAVAVAWVESKLGLYKVRWGSSKFDRSFGIMHTVAYWKTKGLDSFQKGRWIQSMIADDELSIAVGVQDVLYWQGRAKGNWFKGVGMYNGGNKPNMSYARDVTKLVRSLKNCDFGEKF